MRYNRFLLVLFTTTFTRLSFAADHVKDIGNLLQFAVPGAGAATAWYESDGEGGLELGETLGATLAATYALKYSIDEKRPNGGSHSFPSAHTSAAASGAEFLEERYGWQYGIPGFLATAFVGYSRVESKEHHPHDVFAGAALGTLSSYLITKPYMGWSIKPNIDGKVASISLDYMW